MSEKNKEQTRLFTRMVAEKQGWKLNPDPSFYEDLVEGLMNNYNRYGYFLCPCRDSDGSREADKNSICPCLWSRQDILEYGNCFCALYISQSSLPLSLRPYPTDVTKRERKRTPISGLGGHKPAGDKNPPGMPGTFLRVLRQSLQRP